MAGPIAKTASWAVALCALLYIAICALMFFQQRKLMYLPRFTRVAAAQTNFTLPRGAITLRGWHDEPAGAQPAGAVIYLGGNAEAIQANLPALRQWLPAQSLYLLAYRGFGASGGAPTQADLEQDAIALFDEVQRRHPGRPITVIGRSLGTGIASALAAARPVARLALITPFDSMLNTVRDHYGWLPVALLLRDRYPNAERLRHYPGPLLVLRAGQDTLVLPARTDTLLQALQGRNGPPVQAVTFAQASHLDILNAPGFGAALCRFVQPAAACT
jgi:pimeloyl-ACP methyl ester carboxylesterase